MNRTCDDCGSDQLALSPDDELTCESCGMVQDIINFGPFAEDPYHEISSNGSRTSETRGTEPLDEVRFGPTKPYLKKLEARRDGIHRAIQKGRDVIKEKCSILEHDGWSGLYRIWKYAWETKKKRIRDVRLHALACLFTELRRRGYRISMQRILLGERYTEKQFRRQFKHFPLVHWELTNSEAAADLLEEAEKKVPKTWHRQFHREMLEKMDLMGSTGTTRSRAITSLYMINKRHDVIKHENGRRWGKMQFCKHFGKSKNYIDKIMIKSGVNRE